MSSTLSWQQQWQTAFKSLPDLLSYLQLSASDVDGLDNVSDFPLLVPQAFATQMRKGDPHDPLLLQVLPQVKEFETAPGYRQGPLEENIANPIPGLLHKYYGRVLLTLSGACAVHCRYCFRRHFPYAKNNVGTKKWSLIFDYLIEHPEVNEVILSGGDPLALDDDLMENFLHELKKVPSVKYLRFHTRLPIVIPARITEKFIDVLKSLCFRTSIVFHSNHANEWSDSLIQPMQHLREAGIVLSNQSVLLKNINDSAQALIDLSYRLYDMGVLPYYLHLLDKVAGAAHFDVDQSEAVSLMRAITKVLPGYLVPKLVREIPGRTSKVLIDLGMN